MWKISGKSIQFIRVMKSALWKDPLTPICTKINYIECNLARNLNAAVEYIANAQHKRTEYQ